MTKSTIKALKKASSIAYAFHKTNAGNEWENETVTSLPPSCKALYKYTHMCGLFYENLLKETATLSINPHHVRPMK
ncbi:MAG: hypothetical protein NTW08_08995 [Gammaproteobacteria bacterium]|nr:hypothetical protein [Gammaproteobacteria bacterium]